MELYNSITQKTYDPEQCVFFENALQSNAYVFRGNAELKAILADEKKLLLVIKTESWKICFCVFKRRPCEIEKSME